MDSIGQRLRAWRKDKGLSMTDISAKTGLSTGGLSAYERDEKLIGSKPLLALWREYDLDIAWLLTGKKEGELTPEEQQLVDSFRRSSRSGRELILEHAQSISEKLPAELESSVSRNGLTATGES